MKPIFRQITIITVLVIAGLTQSCSNNDEDILKEDIIWDAAPVELYVEVNGSQGENLLSPDVPGNIIGEPITMECDGEKYEVDWENGPRFRSKAYMAFFSGIVYGTVRHKINETTRQPYYDWGLTIGEWPGDESYEHNVVVRYGNQSHEVKVINKAKGYDHTTKFIIDGKEKNSNIITFTK